MFIRMFILLKKSEIRIIKYKIFVWNFVIQSCLKDTPGKIAGNKHQKRRVTFQGIQNKIDHKVKLIPKACDLLVDHGTVSLVKKLRGLV